MKRGITLSRGAEGPFVQLLLVYGWDIEMTDWAHVGTRITMDPSRLPAAGRRVVTTFRPVSDSSSGGHGIPSVRAAIPGSRQTQNHHILPWTRTSLPVNGFRRKPSLRAGLADLHDKTSGPAGTFPPCPACTWRRPCRVRPSAIPPYPTHPLTPTRTPQKLKPINDSPKPTKTPHHPANPEPNPRSLPRIEYPGPRLRH